MGRLIDADNIKGCAKYIKTNEKFEPYIMIDDLSKLLDEQPTAYDLDKVVEELESELEKCNIVIDFGEFRLFEIVKQGGVETDDVCEWTQSGDIAINPHTFSKYKIKQCDGLYALSTCPYCRKKIKIVGK